MRKLLLIFSILIIYYPSFSQQTGCISGDCDNGYGTYIFKQGGKYIGNWIDRKRNGTGTNYWPNGESYTGEYKDDKRFGEGVYFFANGSKYDGHWINDKRNGYGTQTLKDGSIKTGMWEDGIYVGSGKNNYGCISGNCDTGYGVYTWNNGEQYVGEWINKKRNGKGINYFTSGVIYDGVWKEDYLNGYGKQISKNGDTLSGFWENGKYIGENIAKAGCISGDCQNGTGVFVETMGDKYVGQFKNGLYNGQGTFEYIEGDKYIGEFKDGELNGKGSYFITEKGEKYVGDFANGQFNGMGTFYHQDGWTQSGLWKDGEYIGTLKTDIIKPEMSWLMPVSLNTETDKVEFEIKLCIKSTEDVQNVKIYVNDEIQIDNALKGFIPISSNCDYTMDKVVELKPGDNSIKVVAENSGGKTESSVRMIKYSVPANSEQKRLALVFGNSNYPSSPLKNPVNDANAIGKELKSLGFEVMLYTNLSQKDMINHIREFGEKLNSDKGVGLFFYAGHGMQVNGENYIIPVSANIEKEQDIELEAVNVKRLMGEMENAQNELNIIILDACRDNPFSRSFRSIANKGLASTSAPTGTIVAFSTAPGSVASDGEGENGLYTQELLKAISKENMKIEDVFKEVRKNVYQLSNKEQVPWENSSIFGDFFFNK